MADILRVITCIIMIYAGIVLTFKQEYVLIAMRSSWQGKLWTRLLGEERAVFAARKIFGPLCLFGGIWLLQTLLLRVLGIPV